MITKGEIWRKDVQYVEEVRRAVQISAMLTMSPKESLR